MAKVITKTTKPGGKTTKTVVKDTSLKTARQQIKSEKLASKKALSTQAAALAAGGELSGTIASTITSKHNAEVQKERARQQTYQAAINKWNGILKSTPVEAEGTNPSMEGSSNKQGSNNNTGTNPDAGIIGW